MAAFAVAIGLFGLFLWTSRFADPTLGLDPADYQRFPAAVQVAGRLIAPIALIGVLLMLLGAAMTAAEWRGRFAPPKNRTPAVTERGPVDFSKAVGEVISSLSKLSGGTLVLMSGLVVVLAVAWMASSALEPASSPAPTPSATAATAATAETPTPGDGAPTPVEPSETP
ncbi:hypothetical protein [Cryptosporangium sp. NPDC051539]|uniref:hypothetical protein n=1 Tax=Cryptosporangium sp. NPDC051539 TaxID=3363962 RepID=UPI0037A7DD03